MSIFYKYNTGYLFFFKTKKKTSLTVLKRYIKIYRDPFHIAFTIISLNFLIFEPISVNSKIKPLIRTQLKHQLMSDVSNYNALLLK